MRSIHNHIRSEHGKENVKVFHKWEKLEYKMADFSNHRRFTLRCLSKDLIPVSVRLKSNIKTPKGKQIIRKAERALLNEWVRSINSSLTMFKDQIDTCMNRLKTNLDEESMEECESFIKIRREARHFKTLEKQMSKYQRLCHKYTGGCQNVQYGRQHDQDCSKTNPMTRRENNTLNTSSNSGHHKTHDG